LLGTEGDTELQLMMVSVKHIFITLTYYIYILYIGEVGAKRAR